MTKLTGWAMAVLLIAAGVFSYAPAAHACDPEPTFSVTADYLADADFNDPDSQLAQDYRAWSLDGTAEIQVLGVYVYETVYALDADGDWSPGSVSVPIEIWGQWPTTTNPRATLPEDQSGEPPDSCGWTSAGDPLGTRRYFMISTADFAEIQVDDQDRDVLDAAFGAPAIADRDLSLEQDLIAQVNSARTSSTVLFVGLGLAALAAAGAIMYMSRRSAVPAPADEI